MAVLFSIFIGCFTNSVLEPQEKHLVFSDLRITEECIVPGNKKVEKATAFFCE